MLRAMLPPAPCRVTTKDSARAYAICAYATYIRAYTQQRVFATVTHACLKMPRHADSGAIKTSSSAKSIIIAPDAAGAVTLRDADFPVRDAAADIYAPMLSPRH